MVGNPTFKIVIKLGAWMTQMILLKNQERFDIAKILELEVK